LSNATDFLTNRERDNMSEDYREAMSIARLQGQDFHDWTQTFKPDYRELVVIDSDGCRTFDLVYTDGDGGVMVFSNYSEIFNDKGITMSVVGGYCDIAFEHMQEIMAYMEDEMERMTQALDNERE